MSDKLDQFHHPVESEDRLGKMSNSELHRLLSDYRAVYTIFSKIMGRAHTRVKAIQSMLMKRGYDTHGVTVPEIPHNSLKRPVTSGGGVSDHGLIRYLERVKGIDMRAVEDEIADRLSRAKYAYGGAVMIDEDGVSYIMREDGVVKSVMPQEWIDEAAGLAAQESMKIRRRQIATTGED